MKADVRIVEPDARDAKFWMQMGPIFVGQDVLKELPYFTDKGYTWFLAEARAKVLGCAAVELNGEIGYLHHLWVTPAFRGNGVGTQLAEARLKYLRDKGAKLARAIVREGWVKGLKFLGFKTRTKRGQYFVMEKEL